MPAYAVYDIVLVTFTTYINVPLAYVSVYQRMSDILHTMAYGRKQKIGPQQLTTSSENSYSL